MRLRSQRQAEQERKEWEKALHLIPEPTILDRVQAEPAKPKPAIHQGTVTLGGKVRKPIKSTRRLQALLDNERRRALARARRERRETQEANVVDVAVLPGKVRRIDMSVYPQCPHCGGQSIRAGVWKGEQRFRCKACNRTYYTDVVIRAVDADITLVCCRCGGGRCAFRGAAGRAGSGIMGRCHDCNKNFTQGGRYHLDHTLALLVQRIQALAVPPDLRAEVYAQAAINVLQGIGYTWNIPLDVAGARKQLSKETWGDLGSHHQAISGTFEKD